MTVGTSSWDGLGMGLHGEYELTQVALGTDILTITGASSMAADFLVLRDSDGTEVLNIDQRGVTALTITAGSTSTMGFDVRMTSSSTAWNCAGNFAIDVGTATLSGQSYAVRASFDGSDVVSFGGRNAAIMCHFLVDSSATADNASFIHFDDGATQLQFFMTIGNCALDQGCFITLSEPASTHGLRIKHGSTTYYIMCTSCLT